MNVSTHAALMYALAEGAATGGDDERIIDAACRRYPRADRTAIREALSQDHNREESR